MGPHDLETFRHQMSTYLSNALTGSVINGANPNNNNNNDRQPITVPPPNYLPFLMGRIDEKVLARLPSTASHPSLELLYHHHNNHHPHHATQSPNINISSASPTSSSSSASNSSASDIREETSSYLPTFDHHRRVKLELQDATA